MTLNKEKLDKLKKRYPIQTWKNNSILRKKSKKVKSLSDDIMTFAKDILVLMDEYDWAWLAAPQIWEHLRIVAVWQYDKNDLFLKSKFVMINPEVVFRSKTQQVKSEWCLSLPGIEWDVKRPLKIKVNYIDLNKNKQSIAAKWLNASVILHEIDHLNWVLFVDKMKDKKVEMDFSKYI